MKKNKKWGAYIHSSTWCKSWEMVSSDCWLEIPRRVVVVLLERLERLLLDSLGLFLWEEEASASSVECRVSLRRAASSLRTWRIHHTTKCLLGKGNGKRRGKQREWVCLVWVRRYQSRLGSGGGESALVELRSQFLHPHFRCRHFKKQNGNGSKLVALLLHSKFQFLKAASANRAAVLYDTVSTVQECEVCSARQRGIKYYY